jgi:hypothetical protein
MLVHLDVLVATAFLELRAKSVFRHRTRPADSHRARAASRFKAVIHSNTPGRAERPYGRRGRAQATRSNLLCASSRTDPAWVARQGRRANAKGLRILILRSVVI